LIPATPADETAPLPVPESASGAVARYLEERREAQLPSYLRGRASPERPPPVAPPAAHDGRAVLAGLAAASDAAVDSASGAAPTTRPPSDEHDEVPEAIDVLFVETRALRGKSALESLRAICPTEPPPKRTPREQGRSWAERPPEVDVEAEARSALFSGRATSLVRVGFARRPGADPRMIESELVRVVGEYEPMLSRFATLRAMARVASVWITEESRVAELASIVRALDDGLEDAPEAALAPLVERLGRACDGTEGRPTLESVRAHAEETVLAKRAFSKAVLGEGQWVRGTIHADGTRMPLYVPAEFEPTLPNQPRWRAVALVRPAVSRDQREEASTVLAAHALGRWLDPSTLKYQQDV
jgi:hypothetical protein